MVEEVRVGYLPGLVFSFGEALFVVRTFGFELGAAFVDITDKVLIDIIIVGDFDGA
jgi:hypothetical protein